MDNHPSNPRLPVTDLRAQLQEGLAGRYTLERELGGGGTATLFLAHDLKHDWPVALKLLHPELAATLGSERFQREIRLGRRDVAIDSLRVVLADTTYPFTTGAALRVNPFWGRLKGDPKFERLVGAE